MEYFNEITNEVTSIVKRSYEQANDLSTRMSSEMTKVVEGNIAQTREFVELGMKAQKTIWGEWMKANESAKGMWDDMVQTYTKAVDSKAPLKAAK